MITDAIIEAIDQIIEECNNKRQQIGMEIVRDMLGDFEEYFWENMTIEDKKRWVSHYLR